MEQLDIILNYVIKNNLYNKIVQEFLKEEIESSIDPNLLEQYK